MLRLETAAIDRYGPLTDCNPDCSEDIIIIGGPNESGKTLYLEALLQLLDPGVRSFIDPAPRVDESPTGRVVVSDGTTHHTLGNGTTLSDISPIDPINLYTLFVVRDSDLVLPDGTDYYTRLVDRLGDIHTTDIKKLRENLVDEGRLTPGRLNLANREFDTKQVRTRTKSLIQEIDDYLDSISPDQIRTKNRERRRKRQDLEAVRDQLETQQLAKQVHALAFGRDQLATYREATAIIQDLDPFDNTTLSELRKLEQAIDQAEAAQDRFTRQLNEKENNRDEITDRLNDTRAELDELQQRESTVAAVEDALDTYRSRKTTGEGTAAKLSHRRTIALIGIAGAAITGGIGAVLDSLAAVGLGGLLLVVGLVGWYLHYRAANRLSAMETRERELIEAARDAGFDIEAPDAVAPAIRDYRDKLAGARDRINRLEAKLDAVNQQISDLTDTLDNITDRLEKSRAEFASTLATAGVDTISEFESKVDQRAEKEQQRSGAERDLRRELGEPGTDIVEEKIAYWESHLEELEAEIQTERNDTSKEADITATDYDESKLAGLEERETRLDQEIDALDEDLAEFETTLADFDRQATELNTGPFVDSQPTLRAYTVEGLETLMIDLRKVVEAIETNAEISRKAINILDAMQADEQQKVTALFDPDGPASAILSDLTNGRYHAVDYDPESETLTVTAQDGLTLTPHQLSRGTQDQLFMSARLSLAQQLLANTTGFLILDDPFLAADPRRLRHGFEILENLATQGWQIMYFSAKHEVRETIAAEFNLPVHELAVLDY